LRRQSTPLPRREAVECRQAVADQNWQRKFEDAIDLPDGRKLNTLRDATDYITALPEEESELAQWQVAIEALMLVSRNGPTVLARIAFLIALNRNVVLRFNPDAKTHHWCKRKLKRDQ
jgi:hypothetical protein